MQIYLHPYNYQQQSPTLEYAAKHDILIEAYGALTYEDWISESHPKFMILTLQANHGRAGGSCRCSFE